ncbi:hypothetical protein J437_LFUL002412 [Ladona fulva]|uniref:Uncharacterized protein n=1 Tax=Ladona fulva TaxID=123851 RepID=A0A8K0KM42_LADFU|nr:hypothetical protein J437_LFUL002412 [Ladona fulva]
MVKISKPRKGYTLLEERVGGTESYPETADLTNQEIWYSSSKHSQVKNYVDYISHFGSKCHFCQCCIRKPEQWNFYYFTIFLYWL